MSNNKGSRLYWGCLFALVILGGIAGSFMYGSPCIALIVAAGLALGVAWPWWDHE